MVSAITATESLTTLSSEEQREREEIDKGIVEHADSMIDMLVRCRDKRLYRSTHKTFGAYCQDMLGLTHQAIDSQIAAHQIRIQITSEAEDGKNGFDKNFCQTIARTPDSVLKTLSGLPPEERTEALKEAVATAPTNKKTGKPRPTAKHVERVVAKRKAEAAPKPAPEPEPLPQLEKMPWVRPYNECLVNWLEALDVFAERMEQVIALDGTDKAFAAWLDPKAWRKLVKETRLRIENQRVTRWANQKEKDRLSRPFVYDIDEKRRARA
jgi:hypothetical protein